MRENQYALYIFEIENYILEWKISFNISESARSKNNYKVNNNFQLKVKLKSKRRIFQNTILVKQNYKNHNN